MTGIVAKRGYSYLILLSWIRPMTQPLTWNQTLNPGYLISHVSKCQHNFSWSIYLHSKEINFCSVYWEVLFCISSSSGKNNIHYIIYWVYYICDIVLCWLCKDTFVCYTDKWTAFKVWPVLLTVNRKKE